MKMKRHIKKFFAILLAVLTTLSVATPAFAADYKGTVLQMNLPRATDPNQENWGHPALNYMGGWWTFEEYGYTTVKAIDNYEGPTCYCIEPGISLHTGDKLTQKGEDFWEKYPDDYNPTISPQYIQSFVGRILQYGWTGNNDLEWNSTDASDRDEMGNMLATQGLIWEVIVGERDANFNKIDARQYGLNNVMEIYSSNHPCYSEIMSHYRDIEAKVKKHSTVPSFTSRSQSTAQTVELKYQDGKYTATLTDTNGVLSNYSFTSSVSGVQVSKNGNQLTISTATPPTETFTLTANKENSKRCALITWTDEIISPKTGQLQDVVTYGEQVIDPVTAYIKVKVSAGNAQIQKSSEDGYKEGFVFEVTGPAGFKQTVTTDSNGSWLLTNVPAGEYTATEKLTEEQSRYVQPEIKTFTVYSSQTATVTFNNELKRGSAQFQKTDLETGKEIESKDGIFGVYSWDKNANEYERVEQMTYSDDLQAYTTSDLPVTVKNDGKYKILEEVAPTAYANPTKIEFEFTITEDGQIHHINDGTVTNIPQKGRIHLDKQGEALDRFDFMQTEFGLKYSPVYTVQSLSDTEWEITALKDIVVNGDVKYKAGDYVQTITTTEEGATSDPLYLGWYRVREVSTKEGYFIGANEFEIELTYHDQSIDVFTEYITAYNERQHMKVKLEKEIEENPYYPNPDAYKDVIFGVFSEEDITNADGEILLEKDSLVDCFGLNDSYQGQSSVDFPVGTKWYVKELQTAEGFVLNTTQYPFEFTPQPQEIPLIWIDLNEDGTVIKNEWMKGEVELYKKSDFDGKYLKDAVYGIFRESDGLKVDELITDENGYAKSNVALYYGGYYIQELKQPAHYYLDDTKYYFFIGSEGEAFQTIHYDLEDTPKIGHLIPEYSEGKIDEGKDMTSPDTGDHSMPLWIPQALLAISGAAIVGVLFQQKALKKKKSR